MSRPPDFHTLGERIASEISVMREENDKLREENVKMREERDALAAVVERLRNALNSNGYHAPASEDCDVCRVIAESKFAAAILAALKARVRAEALQSIADQLRKAGDSVPLPENKGTIESAMATGLSIALVIVQTSMADEAEKISFGAADESRKIN